MKVSDKIFKLAMLVLILVITNYQSSSAAAGQKKFYLTKIVGGVTGGQVLDACAKGYHMASVFEILDVSNLTYNTSLGLTIDDSGFGPPSNLDGWVRTGNAASSIQAAGVGNCLAWTSDSIVDAGSAVFLSDQWQSPGLTLSPWIAITSLCSSPSQVWCVQD